MLPANSHVIRRASESDEASLLRLAALDSQRPLEGPVLAAEIDGAVAAAISLRDGRMIADPFARTGTLTTLLRMRASGLRAHDRTPSVAARMRAALEPAAPARAAAA
jgi:hypothetical protein